MKDLRLAGHFDRDSPKREITNELAKINAEKRGNKKKEE
jgi:hypothetical protein